MPASSLLQSSEEAGIDVLIEQFNPKIAAGRALVQLCQGDSITTEQLQNVLLVRMLDIANDDYRKPYLNSRSAGVRFAENLNAYLHLDAPPDFPRRVLLVCGPTEQYPVRWHTDFSTNQPVLMTREDMKITTNFITVMTQEGNIKPGYSSLVNTNLNL